MRRAWIDSIGRLTVPTRYGSRRRRTLTAVAGQRFDLDLLANVLRLDEPALLIEIRN
jgi:hypothetical protein